MASYIIQGETLKAIADEVRDLTDITDEINPNEMIANMEQANADVAAQTEIIEQIRTALDGKVDKGFIGIKWLEVNNEGFPIKVDASMAPTISGMFYQYSSAVSIRGSYCLMEEVILSKKQTAGRDTFRYCTKLNKISGWDFSSIVDIPESCFDNCHSLVIDRLPDNLEHLGLYAFRNCYKAQFDFIPASVKVIENGAFNGGWKNSSRVLFYGVPTNIAGSVFINNSNIKDIYVPWSEETSVGGAAPWGAPASTVIHYNTTYDENGEPELVED